MSNMNLGEGIFIKFSHDEWELIQEALGEDYEHSGEGLKNFILDLLEESETEEPSPVESAMEKVNEWIQKNPEKTGLAKSFILNKLKNII